MKHINLLITIFLLLIVSCSGNKTQNSYEQDAYSPKNSDYNNINSGSNLNNYHKNPEYKYEYRTGSSGNYEYNYDVSGSDENGGSVNGNIDIRGKYGSGTIQNEDGDDIDIDVEWTDYGVLEGSDDDGNTYDLEVD